MNTNRHKFVCFKTLLASVALLLGTAPALAQQTAAPPALGEETKGAPAVEEAVESTDKASAQVEASAGKTADQEPEKNRGGILGTATIKESRRENGQVYEIELDHSAGPKQYIQETDSDGQIQSKGNDPEDTPNLPKWKLGSW